MEDSRKVEKSKAPGVLSSKIVGGEEGANWDKCGSINMCFRVEILSKSSATSKRAHLSNWTCSSGFVCVTQPF